MESRSLLQGFQQRLAVAYRAAYGQEAPTLVYGEGDNPASGLMLVGEAPGEQEEKQGRPFVGKAGKNLEGFLQTLGISRQSLYITNVVKMRPSKRSAAGRTINRPPTRQEVQFFVPWLMEEVALVRPKALVTLGSVAMGAFLPKGSIIGACHGRWHTATIISGEGEPEALPLFALYHPAAIIYRPQLGAVYQQDLQTLRQNLDDI